MAPDLNFSEDALIEQPAIALFSELGWETANCYHESFGPHGTLGRETKEEVVLVSRLRPALARLNPALPAEAIGLAVEELTRDRSSLQPVAANREVYRLLKDGVKVTFLDGAGAQQVETVRVVDWEEPANNDFFLASQFWMAGEMYTRRADLVGFVNGIPLLLFELKAAHKKIEHAYQHNLQDYKTNIPQLFRYNALIILSNGSQSKVGSLSAAWEHFAEWKKITSEGEKGIISLETMIRGTCEKTRLLDLVENFTLFTDVSGKLVKLIAKNHQYLGVNNAIAAVRDIRRNQGRLGVFWHTQGSGKSYSMVFFSQKILRALPGNWTFLIVTDRQELDEQIYKNFAGAGVVTEPHTQARSGEHLQQLLREDHRMVFSLIHKFHCPPGTRYPVLSERSDIIVITDEAHRSQYDTLALNMRSALPHAAFIGFTGTPLIAGEEKTREVFGDYVSIYNFRQSVEDHATVPLYYENRIPELQLQNPHLNEDLEDLIADADLDEDQQRKLEREFQREYHLITREDRLEVVARDIVTHFMGRGQMGKAMVVSVDKLTAVKMYDKVRKYWDAHLEELRNKLLTAPIDQHPALIARIGFMEQTDMAVVISPSQNEVEEFRKHGLDILPHRQRMVKEDLETKFKEATDPFRIVFVCAMWITGFDVPSLSTIYLDKPMRNHTLMQTIARANRVFAGKHNGLIVDYIGVFRDLQKALAIYGSGAGGGIREGDRPVQDKEELFDLLRGAVDEMLAFCKERGFALMKIVAAEGFERVKLLDDAVEAILVSEDSKKQYLSLANHLSTLYKAILPDDRANAYTAMKMLVGVIAEKIRSLMPSADIDEVMSDIEALLDQSIVPAGFEIRESLDEEDRLVIDLSQINFEALRAQFETGKKRTLIERLKTAAQQKVSRMVLLNRTRTDYLEQFQQMIDEYNAGNENLELFFTRLMAFIGQLNAEERRGIAENLSEEELVIFDLLTKPDMHLTKEERAQVKTVAHELLETLKKGKLVIDWRKKQDARAQVLVTVQDVLDRGLPRRYTPEVYQQKCDVVYQHIYEAYYGQGQSLYTAG
ncbi:MAG: type I restriction endonuclease subunit R [Armatimonadota bacterium]